MIRVAIEGIDGTGKTTLAKSLGPLLARRWEKAGYKGKGNALFVQYPGDNPVGWFLRDCLSGSADIRDRRTLLSLFIADALETERQIGSPESAAYEVLIQDRNPWVSGFVYQTSEWSWEQIRSAYQAFGLAKPDVVLVLDAPAGIAADRCLQRGEGKYTDAVFMETAEQLEIYRHRYLDIARVVGHPAAGLVKTKVLDATLPAEELQEAALEAI